MIFSRDRILTTHVGSLPRNEKLSDLLMAQEAGEALRPESARGRDGQGRSPRRQGAEGCRHRYRQRRRAAARRLPDLRAAAHVRLRAACRSAAAAGSSRNFPELLAYLMRRFPHPTQGPAGRAGGAGRDQVLDLKPITDETARFNRIARRTGAFSERFMTAPSPGIISTTMLNALLQLPRRLSRCDRARDEQGIPGDPQGRADPADRRARSRDGPHDDVPRSVRQRLRQALRAPRRRDQQGDRGHPARPRAAACLLRQLGRPAHPRHRAGEDPAGALHGECRRAVDRVLQSAPRPRIRRAEEASAARSTWS